MKNERLNKALQDFDESETIEQSLALVDIVKDLLDTTKRHLSRIYIILLVSILSNLVIVGAFLWYESHWDYTTTETITQTVDGKDSNINNIDGN